MSSLLFKLKVFSYNADNLDFFGNFGDLFGDMPSVLVGDISSSILDKVKFC